MVESANQIEIVAMVESDLAAVLSIEESAHPRPWTESIFREELERDCAQLLVARVLANEHVGVVVAGFCNFWIVHDELTILNISIHRDLRRRGIARVLLETVIAQAQKESCAHITLEVRESNVAARSLYLSSGFTEAGVRPKYYADNQEDAILMILEI